jgi:hypothetical protein
MTQDDPARRATDADLEAYRLLLGLWMQENPIKTNKLQVLLAVNGLLISAVTLAGGFAAGWWTLPAAGVLFNVIWTLSIGRTALYQEVWQMKLRELAARHTGDPRFAVLETKAIRREAPLFLRVFGGVSSRWYLVLSPIVLALAWGVVLLWPALRDGPFSPR